MVDKTAAAASRLTNAMLILVTLWRRLPDAVRIHRQSYCRVMCRPRPQESREKQEKQSEAGSALQTGEDANDDVNRAEESQTVKEKDAVDGPDNTQQPQMASISAITTQVLPPSFIPTATGRIRPVTGAFPAIQSASQTEQAQRRRSIRSLAAGSLRRTNIGNAEKAGDVGSAGSTGRTAGMAIRRRRESPAVLPIMRIDQWTDQNGQRNKSVGILDIHAVHARYARFALHCTSLYYVIPIESQQCV